MLAKTDKLVSVTWHMSSGLCTIASAIRSLFLVCRCVLFMCQEAEISELNVRLINNRAQKYLHSWGIFIVSSPVQATREKIMLVRNQQPRRLLWKCQEHITGKFPKVVLTKALCPIWNIYSNPKSMTMV